MKTNLREKSLSNFIRKNMGIPLNIVKFALEL